MYAVKWNVIKKKRTYFTHIVYIYDVYQQWEYSQLCRERQPLGYDKVVAYGRWSLSGKINKISLILYWLINYIKNITLSTKITQIETNLFDFCFLHATGFV